MYVSVARLTLTAVIITAWSAASSQACKYSVRDVGFVALDASPYQLCVCTDSSTPDGWLAAAQASAEILFDETNIRVQWINVEREPDHEAVKFLRDQKLTDLPVGVLMSPEGHVMRVALDVTKPGDEALRVAGEAVSSSPVRDQLLKYLLEHHSVVLLVEGTDVEQNRDARDIAEGAVLQIRAGMDNLPKPINRPPRLFVVSRDDAQRDATLLWSLGLPREVSAQAHMVALFGRGRMMGTPLSMPEATQGDLVNRLGYVGQDCECELDRAVMLGTMIPHRWDTEAEANAVKELGFDPGSPLVKAEIHRILARGPDSGRQNRNIGVPSSYDPLGGYTEIDIDPVVDSPQDSIDSEVPDADDVTAGRADVASHDGSPNSPSDAVASHPSAPPEASTSGATASLESSGGLYWQTLAVAGLVVAVALASGTWVLVRAGRE